MSFQVEKVDLQDLKKRYDVLLKETDSNVAMQSISSLLQDLIDAAKTLPTVLDAWTEQAEKYNIFQSELPAIIAEYIDDEIIDRGIAEEDMEKEIVAMFETGALKNVFKKNGEINQDNFEAWTKQRQQELEKQKYRLAKMQANHHSSSEDDTF